MLENVNAVLSRIDEIKSRMNGYSSMGPVGVAPHYKPVSSGNANQTASLQPYFPDYLKDAVHVKAKGMTQQVSAYDDLIESSADKYGVDSDLIKAVIGAESGYRSDAVSGSGAQGLMQLMPSTAAGLGVSDPFDPQQNIEAGTKYLKSQLDRFGDVKQALAAYNAGPGAVVKYGGVPPFKETQNYVNKVLTYRDSIKSQ